MPDRQLSSVLRHIQRIVGAPGGEELMDRQLLERFAADRDEAAFATLVRRHGPLVMGACRRLLPQAQDAEDVFQATFLVLARKAGSIRWRESVGNWLYEVACRLARKTRVAVARRQAKERESATMAKANLHLSPSSRHAPRAEAPGTRSVPPTEEGPEVKVDCRELSSILDEELQRLPGKYRTPLLVCFLEGRTRDQAARQLGWSLRTLDRRLQQGRDLLRRRLTRRGVTLSAGLLAAGLIQNSTQAAVPAALAVSTLRAALLYAAQRTAVLAVTPGVVSAQVVALVKAASKTMFLTKLKTMTVLLLMAGAVAAGAGVLAQHGPARQEAAQAQTDSAPHPSPLGGEPQVTGPGVSGNPPKLVAEKQVRTDQYGDPLPEGAIARLGTMRFNHGDGLNALYFSPKGKTIISEGGGSIRFWDAASGKELRQFATVKPSFDDQTAISPDGKTMVFLNQDFNNDTVRIWDLAQGKEVRTVPLPVRRNQISIFCRNALSRDGRLCAIHTPKQQIPKQVQEQIRVFDTSTGMELSKLANERDEIRAVIFAGNDYVVTADKKQVIRVWEARTGKPVREFAHGFPVEVLAASPDGRQLATLEHHNHAIDRLQDKDVVQVWDLTTGARKHTLAARPKRWYMNVQFAPDGKFLFTSSFGHNGNELTVWDLETGQRIRELGGVAARAIAVSPDGSRLVEGALPGKFELWEMKSGRRLSSEDSGHARAAAVFLSSDGDRVFTIGYSSISAWDATTGERLHSLDVPRYPYGDPHPRHSPDGRYALSFQGDHEKLEILVWDVVARQRLHTLRPPGANGALTTAFSPDSSLLAAWLPGKETVVRIWNVRTGNEVRSLKESKAGWPGRLFFTANGQTLFVAGKHVVGYDAASGKELFSWRKKPLPGNSGVKEAAVGGGPIGSDDVFWWRTLAVSPGGKTVACILAGGDFIQRVENRIILCEASTGKVLRRCNDSGLPSRGFEQMIFSQDGRLLASSDDHTVHLWEVATGREVHTYMGHRGEIESLAFSDKGRRLASASSDSTVVIWDLVSSVAARSSERATGWQGQEPQREKAVAAWWAALAAEDAATAYAAIWQLAEVPAASVPFLRERLKPVTEAQAKHIHQYIADLDNNSFAVRERAFQNLNSLGPAAGPALRQALEKKVSLEQRRRLEQLLANLNGPISGEPLRAIRALAVLEHAGTPEARRLVQALAAGTPEAWLTQEAKATLERLTRRTAVKP